MGFYKPKGGGGLLKLIPFDLSHSLEMFQKDMMNQTSNMRINDS